MILNVRYLKVSPCRTSSNTFGAPPRVSGPRWSRRIPCCGGKSLFYSTYPHSTNTSSCDLVRRGYFDDLQQYCGVGFCRSKLNTDTMSSITDDGKIFVWSGATLKHLDDTNLNGCRHIKDKQLIMVGYFFELCYELMLSSNHNVSQNPGFESILGIFNKADNL